MTKTPTPLRKKTPAALPKKTPAAPKTSASKKSVAKPAPADVGKRAAVKQTVATKVATKVAAKKTVAAKAVAKTPPAKPAPAVKKVAAKKASAAEPASKPVAAPAAAPKPLAASKLRALVPPAAPPAPAPAPALAAAPVKRPRASTKPDGAAADALFLGHAAAVGLAGSSLEQAWARMPLFGPLLALALVRQGVDGLVLSTIRAAATDVPDADIGDALASLSAPSSRAALTVAEARDEAILARSPSRAALLDAIQHALEGALAREEGDAAEAYERGINTARALTAALASARGRDASDQVERAEIVRGLLERLRSTSPAMPSAV
jgi:hypothetical protein